MQEDVIFPGNFRVSPAMIAEVLRTLDPEKPARGGLVRVERGGSQGLTLPWAATPQVLR
jgi:hypothetical protein